MDREEGERTDQCMGGLRGMGGASGRGRKREKRSHYIWENEEGGAMGRMMGVMRKIWNMHENGVRLKS